MRKTVCSFYRGQVLVELVFDDWTWEHVESVEEEGICEVRAITPKQASELFQAEFKNSCDKPAELHFHEMFSEPFLVDHDGNTIQFDPKGWTLFGTGRIERDWNGLCFSFTGDVWLFGAAENWIEISIEYHFEGEFSLGPNLRFLTKQQAADFLVVNQYRLPSELQGFESIKTLTPKSAASLAGNRSSEVSVESENSSAEGWIGNDGAAIESENAVLSKKLADNLAHVAAEFRALRLISNADEQNRQFVILLERCGDAVEKAIRYKLLPRVVLEGISHEPKGFNVFRKTQSAIELIGYWNPTVDEITECNAADEEIPVYIQDALAPGLLSLAWPGQFDLIYCDSPDADESDSDYAQRCRVENRFEILGWYAYQCEALSSWIQKELPVTTDQTGIVRDTQSKSSLHFLTSRRPPVD